MPLQNANIHNIYDIYTISVKKKTYNTNYHQLTTETHILFTCKSRTIQDPHPHFSTQPELNGQNKVREPLNYKYIIFATILESVYI